MKNIHAIPTDKASRLVKFFTNKFHLCKEILPIHDEEQYQNIYITNDEKIKEGDWCINPKNNKVMKVGHHGHHGYSSKKIILTTDQDLIKDGVQAIPDDFLEWFVKNPSCERVEIETIEKMIGSFDGNGKKPIYVNEYKIIIPKEEPISFPFFDKEKADDITKEGQKVIRELQSTTQEETLEEAAKKYATNHGMMAYMSTEKKESFKKGAKWQQEQDKNKYSEEDMRKMYDFGSIGHFTENESLEQFKKK